MIHELESIAADAVRAAGEVHRKWLGKEFTVSSKRSAIDLVTQIDREAEEELARVILSARPQDSIQGEEGTSIQGSSTVSWVLDPLDGTSNFVNGYPFFAVAVGVLVDGKRTLGVVFDTSANRIYVGSQERGATCDGVPISASEKSDLGQSLIGTGFLPDPAVRPLQAEALKQVLSRVRDIRRSGCPALDLCAVAAGSLDGYYEYGLAPWDVTAGVIIAEAAGAAVSEIVPQTLPGPLIITGSDQVVKELAGILEPEQTGTVG